MIQPLCWNRNEGCAIPRSYDGGGRGMSCWWRWSVNWLRRKCQLCKQRDFYSVFYGWWSRLLPHRCWSVTTVCRSNVQRVHYWDARRRLINCHWWRQSFSFYRYTGTQCCWSSLQWYRDQHTNHPLFLKSKFHWCHQFITQKNMIFLPKRAELNDPFQVSPKLLVLRQPHVSNQMHKRTIMI